MSVKIEVQSDRVTAYLEGELDHHAAAPIRQQIDEAVLEHKPKKLVIDFDKLTFMDSSGIGLVMGRYKTAAEVGATLTVCNISAQVYKVMRLSGIDRIAVIRLKKPCEEIKI